MEEQCRKNGQEGNGDVEKDNGGNQVIPSGFPKDT